MMSSWTLGRVGSVEVYGTLGRLVAELVSFCMDDDCLEMILTAMNCHEAYLLIIQMIIFIFLHLIMIQSFCVISKLHPIQ